MGSLEVPDHGQGETWVAADLLPPRVLDRSNVPVAKARAAEALSAKIYAVMGITTLLTFVTLTSGYTLIFSRQLLG